MNTPADGVFQSLVAFDSGRIHAAAVYCSDGRYGEQFDDFMRNALSLPRPFGDSRRSRMSGEAFFAVSGRRRRLGATSIPDRRPRTQASCADRTPGLRFLHPQAQNLLVAARITTANRHVYGRRTCPCTRQSPSS